MNNLTHFDQQGRAKMVDVGAKEATKRKAIAQGKIYMKKETLQLIEDGAIAKGDVLAVAQVAGVMGAKQTANLIPMCHPLFIEGVKMSFTVDKDHNAVTVISEVSLTGKTGVEMEALTSVTVALLTIYDMCKAVDKEMTISKVQLIEKTGGKSGIFMRKEQIDNG